MIADRRERAQLRSETRAYDARYWARAREVVAKRRGNAKHDDFVTLAIEADQ